MRRSARNRRNKTAARAALKGWASGHLRCFVEAFGRLLHNWMASLLTALVIGITLALPAGLYITVKNLDGLTYSWQSSVQISLYLKQSVTDHGARQLAARIAQHAAIAKVDYISPAEGLAGFREASGLGAALDALPGNPLPPVIAVTPQPDLPHAQMTSLLAQLHELPGVDRAELDQAWLRRLNAILALLERTAWVIGLLLSAAVIFIVGNTIRLDIENRREEIEVMKLVGATDPFIRRPFLYSGMWYGLTGAVFALLLLGFCSMALSAPITALMQSYSSAFDLAGLGFGGTLWLIGGGMALGWSGCALTVNRELRAIEPG